MSCTLTFIIALAAVTLVVPTDTSSSSLAKRINGQGTYYYQNGNAGSRGDYHGDYDTICALSETYPSNNQNCGRTIRVTNQANGNTINALVADLCPSCDTNQVDFSVGAFEQLTGGQLDPPGGINIFWDFEQTGLLRIRLRWEHLSGRKKKHDDE